MPFFQFGLTRPYRLARSGHVPFTDVTGVRIPVGTPFSSATQVAALEGDGARNGPSPSSCVQCSESFIYSLPSEFTSGKLPLKQGVAPNPKPGTRIPNPSGHGPEFPENSSSPTSESAHTLSVPLRSRPSSLVPVRNVSGTVKTAIPVPS